MIRDLFESLSHILNLILVFLAGLIFGAAIVLVDPDDAVSEGLNRACKSYNSKKKGTKTEKARKMGFHLED